MAESNPKKARKKLPMAPPREDPYQSSMYEVIQRVESAQLMSADCVAEILEMYLHTVRNRLIKNDTDYLPGIGTITVTKRDPSLGKDSRTRGSVKMDQSFKDQVQEHLASSAKSASGSKLQES